MSAMAPAQPESPEKGSSGGNTGRFCSAVDCPPKGTLLTVQDHCQAWGLKRRDVVGLSKQKDLDGIWNRGSRLDLCALNLRGARSWERSDVPAVKSRGLLFI